MSQSATAANDSTDAVSEYVENNSTGYTVIVQRIDPDDHPTVEKQGYHGPFILYTLLAGAEVYSHHDRFKIVRQLPGENDWLHDPLRRLEEQVTAGD